MNYLPKAPIIDFEESIFFINNLTGFKTATVFLEIFLRSSRI